MARLTEAQQRRLGIRYLTAAERRARRAPATAVVDRRPSRRAAQGSPVVIGRPTIRAIRSAPLTPRKFARYSRSSRIPAALLLFGIVAGLWALRRGRMPTAREATGLAIGAVVIVALATLVPDLVVAFLAASLIGIAIDESGTIRALADRLLSMLGANTDKPLWPSIIPIGGAGGSGGRATGPTPI